MARRDDSFDPRGIVAALERNRVAYVLIGGLARVIRGSEEVTEGVDVCPSMRPDNLDRLGQSIGELEGKPIGPGRLTMGEALSHHDVLRLSTVNGDFSVVREPAGTRRGYDDLRRAASREHIGGGLRPAVASTADLARMAAALGRRADLERLPRLRRIMEIETRRDQTLGIDR